MSFGSNDPEIFPTYGLPVTWTNESCLLGKPLWVEFSVLSTKSNQVEAKVLTDFLLAYSCCAFAGHSNGWLLQLRGLSKGWCGLGTSSTLLLACHLNLAFSFLLGFPGVHLYKDIILLCSTYGICTQQALCLLLGKQGDYKGKSRCLSLTVTQLLRIETVIYLSGRFS